MNDRNHCGDTVLARTRHSTAVSPLLAGLLICLASPPAMAGQALRDTTFNAQFRITKAGIPLNGTLDVRASLFASLAGPDQVGDTVQINDIQAENGLVNLRLDFGPVFDQRRFLEIAVRSPHDPDDLAAFTTLSPRTELTPTPEAINAHQADTAGNVSVPLALSLNDPNQTTLTVENAASGGVALDVLGDLTVGPQGEFSVEADTGNVLTQGRVTASTLTTTSHAQVGGDLEVLANFDAAGEAHVGGNLDVDLDAVINQDAYVDRDVFVKRDVTVDNDLRVGPTVDFFVNGLTGSATMSGDLSVRGAYFDTGINPGNAGQFLTSTGTGTQWRDLIVAPLNMKNFAITNIGANGSSFDGTGNLNVNGSIDNGAIVADPDIATVQVNDRLIVGPSNLVVDQVGTVVQNGFLVNVGADPNDDVFKADASGIAVLEPGTAVPIFDVGTLTRNTTVHFDLDLDGSLLDQDDVPGTANRDVLFSTGAGVQWKTLFDDAGNFDLNNADIVNIGDGSSSFRGTGLVLNENLFIGDFPSSITTFAVQAETGNTTIGNPAKIFLFGPTGNISTEGELFVEKDAIIFGSMLISGDVKVFGAYQDSSGSTGGLPGDVLTTTLTGTRWVGAIGAILDEFDQLITPGNSFLGDGPEDQHVLKQIVRVESGGGQTAGATTITLDGGEGSLHLPGPFFDSTTSPGVSGQILSSTGLATVWIDPPAGGSGIGDGDHVFSGSLSIDNPDPNRAGLQVTTADGVEAVTDAVMIDATTTESALRVGQRSSGSLAVFESIIDFKAPVISQTEGVTIRPFTTKDALLVEQFGGGPAARFRGAFDTPTVIIEADNTSGFPTRPGLKLTQAGAADAVEVTQTGGGRIGKLTCDYTLGAGLVVENTGGADALQTIGDVDMLNGNLRVRGTVGEKGKVTANEINATRINAGIDGISSQGPADLSGGATVSFDLTANANVNVPGGSVNIGVDPGAGGGSLNVCGSVEVDGTVLADAIVETDVGLCADYVFEPDYPLMPLTELAAFVNENRHLPNVPNAEEVEANGIDIGRFQMRLLEKIEELTLYALQQEERIARLEAQLHALRTECSGRDRFVCTRDVQERRNHP